MALSVRVAQASDAREWDEYVVAHREGRFCHRWAYREVLERVYGYKGVYLQILADGDLAGVFPTMLCGRGARRLISQPFNEYGGPLTGELTANQYEELGGLLLEVAADHGCESYEIRGGLNIGVEDDTTGWARHKLYQYAVLDMDGFTDPATDAFKRQAKKSTRRAVEAGLEVDILRGQQVVDGPFYDLYLGSMKRLGVPPHPRRFFAELAAGFSDELLGSCARKGDDILAILLGVQSGQRVQIYITASTEQHWKLHPNDLSHAELIRWCFANGVRWFDFGSARYSGQIQFKKKWGAAFHDYCYYLVGDPESKAATEIASVNSSSRSMVAAADLWRRLMPIGLTPVLGTPIRRYLTK